MLIPFRVRAVHLGGRGNAMKAERDGRKWRVGRRARKMPARILALPGGEGSPTEIYCVS